MNDLVLDLACILSAAYTNKTLTQEELDRCYEAGARLRVVANKKQDLKDELKERMDNFFKKGK